MSTWHLSCGLADRSPEWCPRREGGRGCGASALSGSYLPGEEFPCSGIFKTEVCFAEEGILGEAILRVLCPQRWQQLPTSLFSFIWTFLSLPFLFSNNRKLIIKLSRAEALGRDARGFAVWTDAIGPWRERIRTAKMFPLLNFATIPKWSPTP